MLTQRLQPAPEDPLSLDEQNFIIKAAIKSKLRLDGRNLIEPRICEVSLKTVSNSKSLAECVLGDSTRVSCLVSAEINVPYPDRPNEGSVTIQTDYMHSAGNNSSNMVDSQLVERSIQKAIDVESLCIVPGSSVWFVKCQIVVINDCGSILDASSCAATAALLHFRRPEVTVIGDEIIVHDIKERLPIPLSINYIPLSISFALIDLNDITLDQEITKKIEEDGGNDNNFLALVDPTNKEESVSKGGSFQIILNAHKEICGLLEGGPFLTKDKFKKLVQIANNIRKDRGIVLDNALLKNPFIQKM